MLLTFNTKTVYLKHDFELMLKQNNVRLDLGYQIEAAASLSLLSLCSALLVVTEPGIAMI